MEESGQVPGVKKGQNRIEIENKILNQLVLSAKSGDWEKVWSIIGTPDQPKNGHMLNAIPEQRRWGVLHQAVFWKTPEVLRRILDFPGCDPENKAKKCMSECGPTDRMTALQVANEYHYNDMANILSTHNSSVTDKSIPTFQSYDGYCDNQGLSLISLTLSLYKEAFHPQKIDPNKSVISVLADVFNDIASHEDRWKRVKDIVADSVYPVCIEKATDIRNCQTRDEFFSQVIRAYSNEDNTIYAYLNMAFRRQRQDDYRPTGDDLAMGPYAVMYQMLLLFWNRLGKEEGVTYRKMKMTATEVDMYVPGTRFVWQSIVSSAINKDHTHTFPSMTPTGNVTALFTITNNPKSSWQPRNIEAHAEFPETERTYPAGAKFQVTDRCDQDGEVNIFLKLL